MILDLHGQGLTVSAIARELGIDRITVRKCIARGLEPPVYGPRKPCKRLIDPFVPYLRDRHLRFMSEKAAISWPIRSIDHAGQRRRAPDRRRKRQADDRSAASP